MNVMFRAPVMTQSGYGVHARQVFSWLDRTCVPFTVQLLPWGDTPWLLDKHMNHGVIDEIIKRSNTNMHPDVCVQLQLPNEWDRSIGKRNVGMTAGIETTVCNRSWCDACNTMDAVVVPSTFTRDTLMNSGDITKPIVVVPESYPSVFDDDVNALDVDIVPEFNFLVFGQITGRTLKDDRKGVLSAISWLCKEFKDNKDIGIVVKTNSGRNSLIDEQVTLLTLKQFINDARGTSEFPRVKLLHGNMTDEEIAGLYKHPKIKVAVALTHGEGFGLPILEAARMGMPLMTTGWSGHMDFLRHGKFINVSYKLVDVHPSKIDDKMFIKGAKWAEPDEDDFRRRARKLTQSYETPKQWARELSTVIKANYSPREIFTKYDETIGKEFLR